MNVIKIYLELKGINLSTSKNKGSGIAIYLKETFLFTVSEEHNQCSPNLETLFITLNNTETPIMIGVAYRPPNGNKVQSLAELNSLMTKLPHSNVYLTGDFNIDLLGGDATTINVSRWNFVKTDIVINGH